MNENFWNELESAIIPSVKMLDPNQEIEIYNGAYKLKTKDSEVSILGSINFMWYPSIRNVFKGDVIEGSIFLDSTESGNSKFEILIDDITCGSGFIINRKLSSKETIIGTCSSFHIGDSNIAVNKITFSIPNLRGYVGAQIKHENGKKRSCYLGRFEFDDGIHRITLDKTKDFDKLLSSLNSSGGYLTLYGGSITKHKGAITLKGIKELVFCFNNFLYFLNGRRTSFYFLNGIHENEILWSDYTAYYCDEYKFVPSWSEALGIGNLNELWTNFSTIWNKDSSNLDFLNSVIHWYVSANSNAAFVEGSIILAQTALELVYNWLLIEQKKIIIGIDATNLSAANKIRLILAQLNVDSGIPSTMTHLNSIKNITDGPEIFTLIRNCLVHGQEKKRKELQSISADAKYEALQLGIWYIELSILYILNYQGKYNNRTSSNKWVHAGENVPWSREL